jgi:DNA-binding beta-propeller fold protein YncE
MPLLPIAGPPQQAELGAFDISFVDPNSHTYALAASALSATGIGTASQPGVVTYDTKNKGIATLLAVGLFAGNCPTTAPTSAAAGQSGPNGVVIVGNQIWVGDAPFHGSPNICTGTITTSSSVKVLDFGANLVTPPILTGGKARSDELCYNPFTNTVLVANDEPADNFITFISTETYKVLGTIKFDGTDPKGNNIITQYISM